MSLVELNQRVQHEWSHCWKSLVANRLGLMVPWKVKAELYDYSVLLASVSKVYCHVTGTAISNPFTEPDAVCAEADDNYQELYRTESTDDNETDQPMPHPGVADVTPYARWRIAAMLDEREIRGKATYGTSLQSYNGRDALRDAMEECADLWQYLCQIEMERTSKEGEV
jgi:hypothetical protein